MRHRGRCSTFFFQAFREWRLAGLRARGLDSVHLRSPKITWKWRGAPDSCHAHDMTAGGPAENYHLLYSVHAHGLPCQFGRVAMLAPLLQLQVMLSRVFTATSSSQPDSKAVHGECPCSTCLANAGGKSFALQHQSFHAFGAIKLHCKSETASSCLRSPANRQQVVSLNWSKHLCVGGGCGFYVCTEGCESEPSGSCRAALSVCPLRKAA